MGHGWGRAAHNDHAGPPYGRPENQHRTNDARRDPRGQRREVPFLGPSGLALGTNVLKLLAWYRDGRPPFWRVVWVHFGKIGLCLRRMNRDGLPRQRGQESMGRCAACDALEPLWRIPQANRTPLEHACLRELAAKKRWLFGAIYLWGGQKRHVEEGAYLFSAHDDVGKQIAITADGLRQRARGDLAHFDLRCQKTLTGEVWGGRDAYALAQFEPSLPFTALDLRDPRWAPVDLDSVFRPKSEQEIDRRLHEHPLGRDLLGGRAPSGPPRRGEPPPISDEDLAPFARGANQEASWRGQPQQGKNPPNQAHRNNGSSRGWR